MQYHKVNMMLLSPNFWNTQEIGNKHYFFTLDKCLNPETTRGFYNEFLSQEFHPHRKTFELLAKQMMCKPDINGLYGLGFNSTTRNEINVKTTGELTRSYNIKF